MKEIIFIIVFILVFGTVFSDKNKIDELEKRIKILEDKIVNNENNFK